MIRVVHRELDHDFLPIPDPGVKKASDHGSGSATVLSGSGSALPLNPDMLIYNTGVYPVPF
jgi:hypothetical protein